MGNSGATPRRPRAALLSPGCTEESHGGALKTSVSTPDHYIRREQYFFFKKSSSEDSSEWPRLRAQKQSCGCSITRMPEPHPPSFSLFTCKARNHEHSLRRMAALAGEPVRRCLVLSRCALNARERNRSSHHGARAWRRVGTSFSTGRVAFVLVLEPAGVSGGPGGGPCLVLVWAHLR